MAIFVWNPSYKTTYFDILNDGLTLDHADGVTVGATCLSWARVDSGKWYWEIYLNNVGTQTILGVAGPSYILSESPLGLDAHSWALIVSSGLIYNNNSSSAYGPTSTDGDVIGIALDLDAGKVWFAKNGTWMNSGDPAAGTGEAFSGLSGMFRAGAYSIDLECILDAHFDLADLSYSPPAGFWAFEQMNTLNLWSMSRGTTKALITNNGLTFDHDGNNGITTCAGTRQVSDGKWYWEIDIVAGGPLDSVGVVNGDWVPAKAQIGYDAFGWGYLSSGNSDHANSNSSFGASWTTGDIIGVALDATNGNVWFSKNGVWQGSGDPAGDSNPAFTGITGLLSLAGEHYYSTGQQDGKFSEASLNYTPPSGFYAFDYDPNFNEVDASQIGFSVNADALSLANMGFAAGVGFAGTIDGALAVRNVGFWVGIGFADNVESRKSVDRSFTAAIGLTAGTGGSDFTKWLQANASHVVYRYFAKITGRADGIADYELSGLKSLQFRMRNGQPSYLSVVLNYTASEAEAIVARQNGEIVVDMVAIVAGEESLREQLLRTDFYSVRYDRGGSSQSISIVGYKTRSYSSNQVWLTGVVRETMLADGRLQFRCALPDFYLRPGDVAVYGTHQFTVGTVTCLVSPGSQFMDVSEAQV
jgi:SPRY domain